MARASVPLAVAASLLLLVSHPVRSSSISTEIVRGAIDSCIGRLNPETDIGYERVAARCPDLARRLEEAGLSAWLPRDWKKPGNDLSSGGLRELGNLLARQDRDNAASPARAHQLDVSHLPAILAGSAGGDAVEGRGWWARTKAWLRDMFEHREEEDDSWFSRVVGQNGLSQAVIELVSYAALALVVVLAVVIVANELRLEGVLGRLWRRYVPRRRTAVPVGAERQRVTVLSWEEVHKAAPAQQPRILLELIASRLTEEGRLPQSRGLTVRELTHLARLPDEADRRRLAELARLSERVRFSNEPVPDSAVGAVLEDALLLLERISVARDGLQA
jgi:hypothetical protein